MKKYKLKKPIVIGLYGLAMVGFLGILFAIDRSYYKNNLSDQKYDYVSQTILEKEDIPVVSTTPVVIRPYVDTNVKIVKDFYDYKADEEKQENSIIYYESTYLQSSGVSYGGVDDPFDVVAILDGTVTSIKEDNTLGKIVEITHSNDMISVYQSLSEINVKENDEVKQGVTIGKSGNSNISKDLNNHLHFELIVKGQMVNPEDYYDKKVDEL